MDALKTFHQNYWKSGSRTNDPTTKLKYIMSWYYKIDADVRNYIQIDHGAGIYGLTILFPKQLYIRIKCSKKFIYYLLARQ